MNHINKLLVLLCAAAPLVVSGASNEPAGITSAGAGKPAVAVDSLFTNVVARGKGVSITQGDLDEEFLRVKSAFAQQGQSPPTEAQILEGIIVKQLLLSKATEADKAKGKETFLASLEKYKTTQKITEAEFSKNLGVQLMLAGITRDQWEKQNIEQSTIPVVIERELKVNVTEADAKKFYDENSASFEKPEMVRAAHILFALRDPATGDEYSDDKKAAKKKLAEDVLKRAKAGKEAFATLAKENSDDPTAKETGGELKPIARGMLQNLPQLESAIFALNTNQISDLIAVPYGFHIVKLLEKMPAKKEPYSGLDTKTVFTMPNGEVAALRDVLADQARQKLMKPYVQQLEKEADVQILDEKLKLPKAPEMPSTAPTAVPAAPKTAPADKAPAKK